MVIGYTRCQTIALNNRYLFDDLKKLGASSAFLTREVKSQCKKVFRTPSIIGISLMFLLYSLIMFGNDGALTYSEIIGLFACAGSLLIVSLVIYMVSVSYTHLDVYKRQRRLRLRLLRYYMR